MVSELQIDSNSIIHRFDPRLKVATSVVLSIIIALSDRFIALAAGLLFALLIIIISKISVNQLLKRISLANGFVIFLIVIFPFIIKGDPLFSIGPMTVYKDGIIYGLIIALKMNTIILFLIGLLGTMPVFTAGRAMSCLYLPDKIIQLLIFTYRYIHVIRIEYQRLIKSAKIRGFQPKTDKHTYKTYSYIIGMILVRSFDRAERVQAAMRCRGFHGKFYDLNEYRFKKSDWMASSFVIIAVAGILYLQVI